MTSTVNPSVVTKMPHAASRTSPVRIPAAVCHLPFSFCLSTASQHMVSITRIYKKDCLAGRELG